LSHLDFRTPIIHALKAIEIVEKARHRIPRELASHSFFGAYDIWRYHAVFDVKLCDQCMAHAKTHFFVGTQLRTTFEYLEIANADEIDAKVHPHCRCTLHRVTDPVEYFHACHQLGIEL